MCRYSSTFIEHHPSNSDFILKLLKFFSDSIAMYFITVATFRLSAVTRERCASYSHSKKEKSYKIEHKTCTESLKISLSGWYLIATDVVYCTPSNSILYFTRQFMVCVLKFDRVMSSELKHETLITSHSLRFDDFVKCITLRAWVSVLYHSAVLQSIQSLLCGAKKTF